MTQAKPQLTTAPVQFSLLAPYNEAATLLGDFTNWEEKPMKKDDQGIFRLECELPDGEHRYRFRVPSLSWFNEPGTWVDVIDPRAREVDPEQQAAIVRIANGEEVFGPYEWQADMVEQPSLAGLVLYELHVGQFGAVDDTLGGYQQVVERLDHLSHLGVKALQLMPVKEFIGDKGMGYNPAYFFAAESSYGRPEELKALVDTCHARGLRVFADMIFNHVAMECPLTQIDHDYWFRRDPKDPDNSWGPEFDYDKVDENFGNRRPAWEFARDTVWFWLQQFHFDGIRFDAVKQIAHREFLRWIAHEAHAASGPKPFLNIAEYIPDDPELVMGEGPMDACWHDSFCHVVRNHLSGTEWNSDLLQKAIGARSRGYSSPLQVINYLSNHDQPRLIRHLTEQGFSPEQAWQRAALGTVLLLTSWGTPMLRMGDEWGETRESLKRLHWENLDTEAGSRMFELHRRLLALRNASLALQMGEVEFIHNAEQVLIYQRVTEGETIWVMLNLNDHPVENVPLVLPEGTWHELFSEHTLPGGEHGLAMAAWDYAVWHAAPVAEAQ